MRSGTSSKPGHFGADQKQKFTLGPGALINYPGQLPRTISAPTRSSNKLLSKADTAFSIAGRSLQFRLELASRLGISKWLNRARESIAKRSTHILRLKLSLGAPPVRPGAGSGRGDVEVYFYGSPPRGVWVLYRCGPTLSFTTRGLSLQQTALQVVTRTGSVAELKDLS